MEINLRRKQRKSLLGTRKDKPLSFKPIREILPISIPRSEVSSLGKKPKGHGRSYKLVKAKSNNFPEKEERKFADVQSCGTDVSFNTSVKKNMSAEETDIFFNTSNSKIETTVNNILIDRGNLMQPDIDKIECSKPKHNKNILSPFCSSPEVVSLNHDTSNLLNFVEKDCEVIKPTTVKSLFKNEEGNVNETSVLDDYIRPISPEGTDLIQLSSPLGTPLFELIKRRKGVAQKSMLNDDSNCSFTEHEAMLANMESSPLLDSTLKNESELGKEPALVVQKTDHTILPEKQTPAMLHSIMEEEEMGKNSSTECENVAEKDKTNVREFLDILNIVNGLLVQQSETELKVKQQGDDLKKLKQLIEDKLNKQSNTVLEIEDNNPMKSPDITGVLDSTANVQSTPTAALLTTMRSNIRYLKTPKVSARLSKRSILTPHSMSFCIQSQFEELMK